ncbi:hypothetical protein NXY28_02210 [Bacteroides thetaiotaomicron]|nr:hypothetical protein NXY28_02210 [Bacteroides thetaiotaomicron]
MIDTEKGEIYYDGELKKQLAEAKPYRTWLSTNRIELDELKSGRKVPHHVENYDRMLRTFGYSKEDIERLIMPMASAASNPSTQWVMIRHWLYFPINHSYSTTISANNSHRLRIRRSTRYAKNW